MKPNDIPPVIQRFMQDYDRDFDHCEMVARKCQQQCEALLRSAGVRAIVTSRAKNPARLQEKLQKRHQTKKPYDNGDDIHEDIVDLSGVRIALYFPGDGERIHSLIEANFDVERVKDTFDQPSSSIYQKQFSGYKAVHYLARLRPQQADDERYTKQRVEIQVASVLMHAWAEVEHDLIYKPGDTAASEEEHAILDGINGMILTGELLLSRLQKAIDVRASQPGTPFGDHYELAMHLRHAIKSSFPEGSNTAIMGRVDVLLRFLQLSDMDQPKIVDQYTAAFAPDTETISVVEQIVDRIITARPDFELKYEQAKEEAGARNPFSFASEQWNTPRTIAAYTNFLLRWNALENFAELLAKIPGFEEPPFQPGRIIEHLSSSGLFNNTTLEKLRQIRTLRNQAVHGKGFVKSEELTEATQFLEALMQDARLKKYENEVQQANVLSSTDALTGVLNRRGFDFIVSHEANRKPVQVLSLMMIDVDGLKKINDAYGHPAGDEVVKAVAELLRGKAAPRGAVGRYGGDEFGVLLPSTSKEEALVVGEQLRSAVEHMATVGEVLTPVTISIGISTSETPDINMQNLFLEADQALYLAKQMGRNRVHLLAKG